MAVDFFKEVTSKRSCELFKIDGLVEMLEAKGHQNIFIVFRFLDAIVDACFGYFEKSIVTQIVRKFVQLMDFVKQRKMLPISDIGELTILNNMISDFKTLCVQAFRCFQASVMGTSKWHILDHLESDLKRCRCFSYLSAHIFEVSHKLFKQI